MKTALFSFEDDATRDRFFEILRQASLAMAHNAETMDEPQRSTDIANSNLMTTSLNTIKLDPPIKEDHERSAAIWISGQKLHEGHLAEMNRVFDQELASHSGSVVMKELRGGEWLEIRARRRQ